MNFWTFYHLPDDVNAHNFQWFNFFFLETFKWFNLALYIWTVFIMPAISSGVHVALFSNFHLGIYVATNQLNTFFKFSLISISNCTIFNCPFRNLKSSIVKIKIIVKHIHIMDLSLSPTPYWDAFDPLNQEFHEKAKQNIRIGKGRKKKNFFQSTISFFLNNSLSLLGLFHVLS